MSSNDRGEARSVILRLRRYRDRIVEIAAAVAAPAAAGTGAIVLRRKLRSLRTDLVHDAHECDIGRRRAVQTECEERFLWPALREAADALPDSPESQAGAPRSEADLQAARTRIQHYLGQLETLYPTL